MIKTEHAGAKNGGGYWGPRAEAKARCKSLRRRAEPAAIAEQLDAQGDGFWAVEDDHDFNCPLCGGELYEAAWAFPRPSWGKP